jgi:hypothetical protein
MQSDYRGHGPVLFREWLSAIVNNIRTNFRYKRGIESNSTVRCQIIYLSA